MRIALYQPDIPQNTGTILRLAACLGLPVDIIEPCGFVWNDKQMRRAGMDYLDNVDVTRHMSWETFKQSYPKQRIVLITTHGTISHTSFQFDKDDILLFGRESAGVPQEVHDYVQARIRIPMRPMERSINLAVSCAIAVSEAMRQTDLFSELK